MRRLFIPYAASAAAIAAVAIGVAACGGGATAQTGGNPYGGTAAKQQPTAAGAAIAVRSTPLGNILVGAGGHTLYLFEADRLNVSNCRGACLSLWPPFTVGGKPQARGGALASKIGTIPAGSGKRQVTYNGHPLYYYAADQKPGDTTGEGLNQFGAVWDVVSTAGKGVDNH